MRRPDPDCRSVGSRFLPWVVLKVPSDNSVTDPVALVESGSVG
jgi:hypothetical protein